MNKVKIKIVKIGKQKNDRLFKRLEKYNSDLFSVDIYEKSRPKCDYEWGYTFYTLEKILTEDYNNTQYDMCIGFVDTIIENNYFGKRLNGNNVYVISFYLVDELLKKENIDPFNFMLSTIYRYLTRFKLNGAYLAHDETKGCIFDMCGDKRDIIYSSDKPIICDKCKSRIIDAGIESNYTKTLLKEIKKIKKSNYHYISEFIKKHPYLSLIIGTVSSITINICSNLLYDLFK